MPDSDRNRNWDVIVVGGGPAGLTAARVAAEAGVRVLVLEEHPQVGRPVRCTGLLSPRGLEEAGIPPDSQIVLRAIRGGIIHAPDGFRMEIEAPEPRAYVLDRAAFDRELARRARRAGAEIWTGVRAVGLHINIDIGRDRANHAPTLELHVRHGAEQLTLAATLLIGADGAEGRVARWAGLGPPRELIYTLQAEVAYRLGDGSRVEVFLGERTAPGFFAWAVPAGAGRARIGLGSPVRRNLRDHFVRLLERFGNPPILEVHGGVIPLGPPARTVAEDEHILLVGDAAAQVKPTSGGGLYTGLVCARFAGEVAAEAVKRGELSPNILQEYERRWRAAIGRELELGLLARRVFTKMDDASLSGLIRGLAHPEILAIIEQYGDIDYPSRLLKELLKRPKLWGRLLGLFPSRGSLAEMVKRLASQVERGP